MSPTSSPFPPELPAGRITFTSPNGQVRIVLDDQAFEWWMDASPFAAPADVDHYLDQVLIGLGYELLNDDECEPVTLDDGFTRIYCVPIVPVGDPDDFDLDDDMDVLNFGGGL